MKRGLILGIIISLFLVTIVSAATTSYNGEDLIITSSGEISGNHTNINNLIVMEGVVLTVKPYDNTANDFGYLEVHANNIIINGTIDANGAGYGGGGGGGGGGGDGCKDGSCGSGGSGIGGGADGSCIAHGDGGGAFGGDSSGQDGGYMAIGLNEDNSEDESVYLGGGGAGGNGGSGGRNTDCPTAGGSGGGGGAGGSGGGIIRLYSIGDIIINGNLYSKGIHNTGDGGNGESYYFYSTGKTQAGDGGDGGDAYDTGLSSGGSRGPRYPDNPDASKGSDGTDGGSGAGGGILIKALGSVEIFGTIDNSGAESTTNGGTVKVYCGAGGNITEDNIETGRYYNLTNCDIFCGDGIPNGNEECDDQNTNNNDACLNTCMNNTCGDGYINDLEEECDDGDVLDNGCNSTCGIESGWKCIGQPSSCCQDECILNDLNLSCIDFETKLSKQCVNNTQTTCFEWEDSIINCSLDNNKICSSGQCIALGTSAINFCSDYINQSVCEFRDNINIFTGKKTINSILEGEYCDTKNPIETILLPSKNCSYFVKDCECVWDQACISDFMFIENCTLLDGSTTQREVGSCEYTLISVDDNCNTTGTLTQSIKATPVPNVPELSQYCKDITKTYSCPDTSELGFFSDISLIIAMLLIVSTYIYIVNKKKLR